LEPYLVEAGAPESILLVADMEIQEEEEVQNDF
jgi:hypothetical protein